MRFQPGWVRVSLEEGNGRLLLLSHGCEIEIGSFLAESERVAVSKKLKVLLVDVNDQQRNQVQQRCKT